MTQEHEMKLEPGTSLWAQAFKRLRQNRAAMLSTIVVGLIAVACFLGPLLIWVVWGYDYESQNLSYGAQPPSWKHWFGTDYYGRDTLTRVLYGGQISLMVGLLAASVASIVGTIFGAISGFFGGWIDAVMMRIVDVVYTLPYMFLVIILVTIFGQSLLLLFLALGCVSWLTTARIVRANVLSLKEQEFVLAAQALGVGSFTIIFRHIIPNTLGPIVVYFSLTVPSMILQEAFLSFLGLGVQAPRPSLGALINDGANQMLVYWWQLVFPASIMALLLFSLNFVGDGLRDALDPKLRK